MSVLKLSGCAVGDCVLPGRNLWYQFVGRSQTWTRKDQDTGPSLRRRILLSRITDGVCGKALENGVACATWPSPLSVLLTLGRLLYKAKYSFKLACLLCRERNRVGVVFSLLVLLVRNSTNAFVTEEYFLSAALVGVGLAPAFPRVL